MILWQNQDYFVSYIYFLEKGSATAPELARLFEVSVRTIYRDIERLSMDRDSPLFDTWEDGRNLFNEELSSGSLLSYRRMKN